MKRVNYFAAAWLKCKLVMIALVQSVIQEVVVLL